MTNQECTVHAPVYQRSPVGAIRVGCPHCKDAEISLLKHEVHGSKLEIERLRTALSRIATAEGCGGNDS